MPLKEMNSMITRFGSNMNQIVKRVNSTHNIYSEGIEEIKEMMAITMLYKFSIWIV